MRASRVLGLSGVVVSALMLTPFVSASDVFTTLDYEAALAKATADDLVFLVDATAEWCGPCKRMERETWNQAEVAEALSGVALPIQVDVDEQEDLARQLKIRAMPTIIAIRGGKEIDRHVGYLGPEDFLEWFDAVRQGVSLTEQARLAVVEKDDALQDSSDEQARYEQAEALVGVGEYDRAERHYLWLWENISIWSGLTGVRASFMLSDMADLAELHPPARTAFNELQSELYERIQSEPASLSQGEWSDWFRLSRYLEESQQVIRWFDSARTAEGEIPAELLPATARHRVLNEVQDLLLERNRLVDAAKLGVDLGNRTSWAVNIYKESVPQDMLDALPPDMVDHMKAMAERSLRKDLARYHAVALLADDSSAADRVAERLLDFLDDADSRVELVRVALEAGVPPMPQFATWLDEAAELGEPVGKLRKKLEQAGG